MINLKGVESSQRGNSKCISSIFCAMICNSRVLLRVLTGDDKSTSVYEGTCDNYFHLYLVLI